MGSGAADVDLRERIAGLMGQVRAELAELVAIPSVADPRQFPPEECARAARWVRDAFAGAGFADAWLAEMSDGSQAVLGSRPCADPDAATVLLYSHYDVQPPLNEAAWRSPPFELTEVDGRWYGRGTADCKGNILMHLAALRALGDQVPVNLKLVIEGSEETTGALEEFVPGHADLLRADAILIGDGGNAAVGQPAVTREPARRGGRDRRRGRARVGAALGHVRRGGSRRPGGAGRDAGHAPGRSRQHHDPRAGQHPGVAGRALPCRDVPGGRRRAGGGLPARGRHGVGHGLVAPGGHHPRHRLPAGGRVGGRDNAAGERPAEPARPARDADRRRSRGAGPSPARRGSLGRPRDDRDRIRPGRPSWPGPAGPRTRPSRRPCTRPTAGRW